MKPDYKLVAKAKYIHMTADLASEVWHESTNAIFPQSSWTPSSRTCRAPTLLKRTSTTM